MAYHPPRAERPSRRERSMNEYAQLQDTQNQSQAADAQSQAALMAQLAQMYGIQHSAALDPSQIAQSEAQAQYQQLVNASYPKHMASILAAQNAGTAQTQTQTHGLEQQQGAFPEQNAGALALQAAQTQHLGEQTKALGFENEFGAQNAGTHAGLLQGQLQRQPFEQQQLQLQNAGLEGQNAQLPEHLRGMRLTNEAQQTQNNWQPYQLDLQTRTGENALDTSALQQEMLRQQNAWYETNQQQQYNQNAFDTEQMNPLKLQLGQEQINSSRGHNAGTLYGMGGLTLPQAQEAMVPELYKNTLKPVYDNREKVRAEQIALDQQAQGATGQSHQSEDPLGRGHPWASAGALKDIGQWTQNFDPGILHLVFGGSQNSPTLPQNTPIQTAEQSQTKKSNDPLGRGRPGATADALKNFGRWVARKD